MERGEFDVSRWKQVYGSLIEVKVQGDIYIARPLTEKEYKSIWGGAYSLERGTRDFNLEYETVKNCVLFPENITEMLDSDSLTLPGGILNSLCGAILEVSDFSNTTTIDVLLKQYRQEIEVSTIDVLKNYILAAEIGYTLEELENMTMEKICKLTAHAEQVTIFRHIQRQKAQYGDEPQVIEFLSKREMLKRRVEREMAALQPEVDQLAAGNMRRG